MFLLQRLRNAIDLLLSIFPCAFQLAWKIQLRGEVVTDAMHIADLQTKARFSPYAFEENGYYFCA